MAAPQAANPLLETTLPISFDRIKPEHVVPAARLALEEFGEGLDRSGAGAVHLGSVALTPEVGAALAQTMPLAAAFRRGFAIDRFQ